MTYGVEVKTINLVPGPPYSKAFRAMDAHVPECLQCQSAMAAIAALGMPTDPGMLCEAGRSMDLALRVAIEFQRETSISN